MHADNQRGMMGSPATRTEGMIMGSWSDFFSELSEEGPKYNALERSRPELLKPETPGEHVWTLLATYRVSTSALQDAGSGPLIMDGENLAGAEIGCWVCATRWAERQDDRVCPGSPTEQILKAMTQLIMAERCKGCESPLCPDCRERAA